MALALAILAVLSSCGGKNSIDPRGGIPTTCYYYQLNEVLPGNHLLKNIEENSNSIKIDECLVYSENGKIDYNKIFHIFLYFKYRNIDFQLYYDKSPSYSLHDMLINYNNSSFKNEINTFFVGNNSIYVINDGHIIFALFEINEDIYKVSGTDSFDTLKELLFCILE